MAQSVLWKIVGDLQATEFISVMIDECTDIQNKEQVNIIFRKLSASLLIWCCLIFQVVIALC